MHFYPLSHLHPIFPLGGSPRCRASSVPASLRLPFLAACQPFSCPPPPPPPVPCPDRYLDFNFRLRLRMARLCPALLSSRPPGSQCLFAPPAGLSHLDVGSPASFSPHALPCHRYFSFAASPCASCCTTWQARSACLPFARRHRL